MTAPATHPPVGIDLGLAASVVAAHIDGTPVSIPDLITRIPIVPSVVGVSDTGEIHGAHLALDQAVGHVIQDALQGTGGDSDHPLGGRIHTAEEIAPGILSYLKSSAEGFPQTPIGEVVISVPANREDGTRRAVLRPAVIAGLRVVRLVDEAAAAVTRPAGRTPTKCLLCAGVARSAQTCP